MMLKEMHPFMRVGLYILVPALAAGVVIFFLGIATLGNHNLNMALMQVALLDLGVAMVGFLIFIWGVCVEMSS